MKERRLQLSIAMPEVAVPPPIVSHTFTDADELESLFNRQQDFHVMPLDLQPLRCHLLHLQLEGAVFAFRELQNPLHIWGDKRPGVVVLEFLMSPPSGELLSHGFAIQPDSLYGFDSSRGIDMVTPANAMIGSLIITQEIFQDCLQTMGRTDLDDRFWATNHVQSPETFASVQRYLRELYGLIQQRSAFLHQPQISKLLLEDYLPLLIEALPPVGPKPTITGQVLSRSQLVRQAKEYMLAHLGEPFTLQDLCKFLNTSKSPLNYGFQEVFGISPMAYLKRLRLYSIHKALKTADPTQTKVVDLAHRFGFWHMGRFSQEYKQMFGELPSATLQQ